jgi:hypothetical protein
VIVDDLHVVGVPVVPDEADAVYVKQYGIAWRRAQTRWASFTTLSPAISGALGSGAGVSERV